MAEMRPMYYDDLTEDDLEILEDFVEESEEGLATVAALLNDFTSQPGDKVLVDAIFRPIHSIKGNSAFLGLIASKHLSHESESVLDLVRKDSIVVTEPVLQALTAAVTELKQIMGRIRARKPEVADKNFYRNLLQTLAAIRRDPVAEMAEPPLVAEKPKIAPPAADPSLSSERERKLRIGENAVHALEQLCSRFAQLPAEMPAEMTQDSAAFNTHLQNLVMELQQQVQALWHVSVEDFLQRIPRIVTDVCRSNGKQIRTHINCADITLDRRLLTRLEAPLLHIVRNAADHGVESAQVRSAKGKPVLGNIWVQFSCANGDVVLKVIDDGGGIDYRNLAQKAIQSGLWPRERKLTPNDLNSLVFLPGLSTAATVSDISGRGVGMDVVKTEIEKAGGKIRIASKPDKGTAVEIRIPRQH